MEPTIDLFNAIKRLFEVASRSTDEARHVCNFLLAWEGSGGRGLFDLSFLDRLDRPAVNDVQTVFNMLCQYGYKRPSELGFQRHIRRMLQARRNPIVAKPCPPSDNPVPAAHSEHQAMVAVLSSLYLDSGRSGNEMIREIANMTTDQVQAEVTRILGAGHVSTQEMRAHIVQSYIADQTCHWPRELNL